MSGGDRADETAAAAIVAAVTGLEVVPHDDGSQPSMADFGVRLPDGSMAALEVTSALDTSRRTVEAQLQPGARTACEGRLVHGYWADVYPHARIPSILERLCPVMLEVEALGIDWVHDGATLGGTLPNYRQRSDVAKALKQLGIRDLLLAPGLKPGVHLGVTQDVATYAGDMDVVTHWTDRFLASHPAVAKAASGSAPGHLFIWTNRSHEPDLVFAIQDEQHGLPTRPVDLPPEVQCVWIATQEAAYRNLRHSRATGWQAFPGGLW